MDLHQIMPNFFENFRFSCFFIINYYYYFMIADSQDEILSLYESLVNIEAVCSYKIVFPEYVQPVLKCCPAYRRLLP